VNFLSTIAMASAQIKRPALYSPFLVAELALGSLPDRSKTLAFLNRLIQLRPVLLADVRLMIEARSLASTGIGLTDAHLIASCLSAPGARIWTLDGKLGPVADSLLIRALIT
jgi:hypothetical protein